MGVGRDKGPPAAGKAYEGCVCVCVCRHARRGREEDGAGVYGDLHAHTHRALGRVLGGDGRATYPQGSIYPF